MHSDVVDHGRGFRVMTGSLAGEVNCAIAGNEKPLRSDTQGFRGCYYLKTYGPNRAIYYFPPAALLGALPPNNIPTLPQLATVGG